MTTFYDRLEVSPDASQTAIRDAYREQVKRHHPDVCDDDDAQERFKRIKRAEEVLGDPEERALYDEMGHEAYVDAVGDVGEPSNGRASASDEAKWAAARASVYEEERRQDGSGGHHGDVGGRTTDHTRRDRRTDGDSSTGGRSAGWRDRERRAHRTGSTYWHGDPEWWESETGGSPGGSNTGGSADGSGAGASADAPGRKEHGDSGRTGNSGRTDDAGDATTAGRWRDSRGSSGASATDGGRARRDGGTHAVRDWTTVERTSSLARPDWTQSDVVILAATMFLYPILLFLIVLPILPTAVNVGIGLFTLAYVGFLLTRPSLALPVFGTWSFLVPAALLSLDVPLISGVGLVTLGGVWLPLLYAVAVAFALARSPAA